MIEISSKVICKLTEEKLLFSFLKMEKECRESYSIPLSESDKAIKERAQEMNIELFNNSVIRINVYLKQGYRKFDIYMNLYDMIRGIYLINDCYIGNIQYGKLHCKWCNQLDKELYDIGKRTGYFFCSKPYEFKFKHCKHC